MGNRLSKIITRTGDKGTTGLADGSRRAKNDVRVHCLGEVDELNATLGGAELCQPGKLLIQKLHVDAIESSAAQFNESLPPLKEFILPGGSQAVAFLHLARTVCRRVERSLLSLKQTEDLNPITGQYINRLSDLLFILARSVAHQDCGSEVFWRSKYSRLEK